MPSLHSYENTRGHTRGSCSSDETRTTPFGCVCGASVGCSSSKKTG